MQLPTIFVICMARHIKFIASLRVDFYKNVYVKKFVENLRIALQLYVRVRFSNFQHSAPCCAYRSVDIL